MAIRPSRKSKEQNDEKSRYRAFTRRAVLLGGAQMLMLSALAGRMYYLQIIEGQRYHELSEDNRINLRLLPPPRGRILDRYGVPLADNEQNYRVVMVREDAGDLLVRTPIRPLHPRAWNRARSMRPSARRETSSAR